MLHLRIMDQAANTTHVVKNIEWHQKDSYFVLGGKEGRNALSFWGELLLCELERRRELLQLVHVTMRKELF